LRYVKFDAYCVNTVDPETLVITSSIGDGLSADVARRLFEIEESGTDFNALTSLARGPVHVATLAQATGGEVTRSQRMRELFLALGFGDELRAALVVDRQCWGYLHLFRAAVSPAFDEIDVACIEQARPLVGGALRAACLVGQRPAISPGPAVLLLDAYGQLAAENGAARAWLGELAGDVGGALPHPIYAVRSRARAGAASARYRTPAGDWLAFHGSSLPGGVALVIGAAGARELAPLLFLAHGLTAREREVAGLLLHGRSNAEIAAALGIGLYTAKDHVKAILEKTQVANRADFAASFAV
jgi:DNA-binding CsgD family transcriptional regulator